jgi:hypothetical protein
LWAQPEAAFRAGGIDYQLAYIDTLKRELHGTTKESEQLLAQDLPALNDSLKSLKSKGQQPPSPPPAKVGVNDSTVRSLGAIISLPAEFRICR